MQVAQEWVRSWRARILRPCISHLLERVCSGGWLESRLDRDAIRGYGQGGKLDLMARRRDSRLFVPVIADMARAQHAKARPICLGGALRTAPMRLGHADREAGVVLAWLHLLVLAPLNDIKPYHSLLYLLLELLKVNDELIAVLVEGRSVLPLDQPVDLKLLVDDSLNLLHRLKDQKP